VDYFPKSQAKLPPEQRDTYKAVETTAVLRGLWRGGQVA
jgi:hypothetical protein